MTNKKIIKFSDICREVKITTQTPIIDGYERYVGLEHLDSGSLNIKRWGMISEDNPSFTRVFKKGHILFGKRRPYLRKAAIAEFDGICSGDIIVMEAKGEHYLHALIPYICQSDDFWEYAIKNSSGSLSPRTKFSFLKNYQLRHMSASEQGRCLAKIHKIDNVLGKLDGVLTSLQNLKEKTLNQLFTIDTVDRNETVGTELFKILGGYAPSKINFNPDGNVGYFKVDDFNKNENHRNLIISSERFNVEEQANNISILNEGFLIFPKRGAAIFKNRVGILGKKATVDSNLMALECFNIESKYLRVYLEWFGLHNISDNSGIPQINNKHVYPLLIPVFNKEYKNGVIEFDDYVSSIFDFIAEKKKELIFLMRQLTKIFKV